MEYLDFGIIDRLASKSIDFHCHGIGTFDFTEIPELSLQSIEDILAARGHHCVLTLYLPKLYFGHFLNLMDAFSLGKFPHIVGIGLEGPVLASHGGTPGKAVWMPSVQQWKELASCGKKGLIYVILSPDAQMAHSVNTHLSNGPRIGWISETLLEGGVLPAPGHFSKSDPQASANALQSMFNIVESWGQSPTITDHLFNDMPLNFKHAWRTSDERVRRSQDIESFRLDSWSLDLIEEQLGPVPAVIIRNAHKGIVKACQNFDGEHVDLAIVKKTIELLGAENMLFMTDSIESKRLAGITLRMHSDSTLLYQEEDIVAAGSQGVSQQIQNMLSIGLSVEQVETITNFVPIEIIKTHGQVTKDKGGIYATTNCV